MGTLRTSEIFNDSTLRLIAVESVDLRHNKTNTSCQLYGNIKPIAVIVSSPDEIYAIDMAAKPANIEKLGQNIPELNTIVAALDRPQDAIED